ncbi:MAG: hypothetical protein ACTTJ7_00365 [Treponema sp.]
MMSNYAPLSALPYVAMPRVSNGGHAYLPVEASQLVYANFRYVSGVPRNEGQAGVSIGKLTILNTLIDQLVRMQESEKGKLTGVSSSNENTLDTLIEYVSKKINTVFETSKGQAYAPFPPQPAALLNLTA